ncbi:Cytochrome P450 [Penicillium fimorum]|uniref:Cytochrome P450 n=1 Tax=Penicillium fimorum TaxID=1882269 RepID=A0A9W9XQZ4_9EURO|nr:Cytochrome P450 [Penicillium fimorum]
MAFETVVYAVLSSILVIIIHRVFLHPLRHVPGPFFASFSSLFLYAICYLGVEGRVTRYLHQRFRTPVLRVGPNSVCISDSSALREVLLSPSSLLVILNIATGAPNPWPPLFAPARIRSACALDQPIGQSITEFVKRLRIYQANKVSFDLVDLCARLSIDVVTGYLLGEPYGGFAESAHLSAEEQQEVKLSANPFVFAIVAFSRFSLLPNFFFRQVYKLAIRLSSTDESIQSFHKLDQFATEATFRADVTSAQNSTYQSRLLEAGISPQETAAQCKAVIFAGADSTAVMLATVIFHLIQNENARHTLAAEVAKWRQGSPSTDPESIPYLRAVVKEGLRLGMANPTRLTRVIPAYSVVHVGGHSLPAGTVIGFAAYNLHHDEAVFPQPFEFRPERWLEDRQDGGLMERNMIPFGR